MIKYDKKLNNKKNILIWYNYLIMYTKDESIQIIQGPIFRTLKSSGPKKDKKKSLKFTNKIY